MGLLEGVGGAGRHWLAVGGDAGEAPVTAVAHIGFDLFGEVVGDEAEVLYANGRKGEEDGVEGGTAVVG